MFSVSHYDNVVFITSDSTYTMSSFMVSLQKEDKHYVKTNNLISALMLQKSLRQRSEAAKRVMIVFLMLDRIKFYINIKYSRGIFSINNAMHLNMKENYAISTPMEPNVSSL